MDKEIIDERIDNAMKRIQKAMVIDVDSDNSDERIGQLMILCIQEGYREYMIELEKYYLNYSSLNKNDKFHCKNILDILNGLDERSQDKIRRVLLNKFAFEVENDGN